MAHQSTLDCGQMNYIYLHQQGYSSNEKSCPISLAKITLG